MRCFLLFALLAGAAPAMAQDCVDPTAPVDDCDRDGVTPADDDCDDEDPDVFPGAVEICDDGIDNNCNAEIDDDCSFQDGELSGGSGCGADDGWALIVFPWFLLLRKRRS